MTEKQQTQPPFNLSPQIQAELTTLNVRYIDIQETMNYLLTYSPPKTLN